MEEGGDGFPAEEPDQRARPRPRPRPRPGEARNEAAAPRSLMAAERLAPGENECGKVRGKEPGNFQMLQNTAWGTVLPANISVTSRNHLLSVVNIILCLLLGNTH